MPRPRLAGHMSSPIARREDALENSPALRRAIELTANLAERRGTLGSVERSLRAADIPLRPAEVIFAYAVLAGSRTGRRCCCSSARR